MPKQSKMLSSSFRSIVCRTSGSARALFSTSSVQKNNEKVWENPWKHALPEKTKTLATVEEVPVDWSFVERLMPIQIIPEVPKHESYPTPSGWTPPTELGKTHSYYVRRRPDHLLPLFLERKRDLLNEKTLDFDYVELVTVRNVDGDVFACEQDLRSYLEEHLGHPIASHVDELKGRIKQRRMPVCCTNCRTKYSLLNREAGCSSCALSFCKKCLSHRSIIPSLSDRPMIVCDGCYEKLEAAKMKPEAVITSTPLPSTSGVDSRATLPQSSLKNWWGDGHPPPSFRDTYGNPSATTRPFVPPKHNAPTPAPNANPDWELEQRRAKLRQDLEPQNEALSQEEIEERFAKLRGVDVELIRNPRSWFAPSETDPFSSNQKAKTPAELIKIAEDRARIEQKEEEADLMEIEEFEKRRRQLRDEEGGKEEDLGNVRESVVSGGTEFSEATKEEMNEINGLLNDAEKRVAETRAQEEKDTAELRSVMKATRQKSLDAMQWNEKISGEMAQFWDRRNEKEANESSDEDEIEEEQLRQIIKEAEETPDQAPAEKSQAATTSPKKKGFFEKIFRKDSKH
ncbi:unnamed protein product [Caenorhabditis sp. 36 PRJEB53466]|nr:unnamed protein product [Caenorhabditis sp. 36 PRJEB53466]